MRGRVRAQLKTVGVRSVNAASGDEFRRPSCIVVFGRIATDHHEGLITAADSLPVTLRTYARATVAAGNPIDGSIPYAMSVSVTHGGLTTLTRIPRGASSAAARAKPSTPALTRLIAPLPFIGCCDSTPLVSVNDPPSRTLVRPYRTRFTCPISLLPMENAKSESPS